MIFFPYAKPVCLTWLYNIPREEGIEMTIEDFLLNVLLKLFHRGREGQRDREGDKETEIEAEIEAESQY